MCLCAPMFMCIKGEQILQSRILLYNAGAAIARTYTAGSAPRALYRFSSPCGMQRSFAGGSAAPPPLLLPPHPLPPPPPWPPPLLLPPSPFLSKPAHHTPWR